MPHWLDKVLTILQAQTADLRELARIAGGDPKIFYRGISRDRLDLAGQDIDGMEFLDDPPIESPSTEASETDRTDILRNLTLVRNAPRAEERVALLILAILQNRDVGAELLQALSGDRSKYARSAVRELKAVLASPIQMGTLDAVDLIKSVRRHYVHAFPDSRAALIFYMAKHLSVFPGAKDYLRESWSKSYSYAFRPYAQEMQKYLK